MFLRKRLVRVWGWTRGSEKGMEWSAGRCSLYLWVVDLGGRRGLELGGCTL